MKGRDSSKDPRMWLAAGFTSVDHDRAEVISAEYVLVQVGL